jgi:hypothetical protein
MPNVPDRCPGSETKQIKEQKMSTRKSKKNEKRRSPEQEPEEIVSVTGEGGESPETAFVVHATSPGAGIPAEYEHISFMHGRKRVEWDMESQRVTSKQFEDGTVRYYDNIAIKLEDGTKRSYYFDITQFYG